MRNLGNEDHVVRNPPIGDLAFEKPEQLVLVELDAVPGDDDEHRPFAPLRMLHADHGRLFHRRMASREILDLDRADPLPAGLDQILRPVCDVQVAVLIDARDVIERETAEALNKGELMSVADRLANYQPAKADKDQTVVEDADWPQLWLLRLATQLSRSGQSDKALELIASVPDMQKLWREEGYQLLAALIAKSPAAAESLWKKYNSSLLSATEQVAMFRGLCNGLSTVIDVPQSQDGKNLSGKKD